MWAFCGGEHVVFDGDVSARFRTGYRSDNRPIGESGPDLNRLSWESKRQEWSSQRFEFIAPGKWMADCVAASALLKHHPTHTVPNPIELNNLWHPIDKSFARAVLGLDQQKKYVLSGSAGGMAHLKGEDLLNESLTKLSVHSADAFELLIFGQSQPLAKIETPFKTRWLGRVNDDHVMRLIYSASDVMAVPSRIDNLPNTAIEAHACGVPVVAFDVGGLPDIVDHLQSGWLAPAFDTDNFARGISWALQDSARWTQLSSHARKIAEQRFAPKIISEKYLEIYQKAIAKQRTTSQDV
jgi:glycosyltransferase involved in cell wall biosynthesis